MKYLILTDIFGLSVWTDALKLTLEDAGHHVMMFDPYKGKYLELQDESSAYDAFCQHSTHDNYYLDALGEVKRFAPDTLIGFSAGASAAWRIANVKGLSLSQIHCFYPSQIRYFHDLSPKYSCQLILPSFESSFDVAAMGEYLKGRAKLEIVMSEYGHGFMNPLSAGYEKQAETYWLAYLLDKPE
ncbi:hypothetical protein MED121_04818 [Marinomonas sp. MED121]|uniref:hypothetical protein n=1 Tax=Marinomonas sp. MED121 TaxID=314277 RepID=UPI000069018B|nr:hypothetical protein [Marinomonas sp. MED121]EAQ64413.1 hypothetical protein MED121_04818 [Marinomonas sp. MED121]